MRMTRQTKFGLWVAAAAIIAIGSFLVGSALKPNEAPHYVFDTEAPAYGEPSTIAARSPGGFTGFGESDGSASRVVISGRVVELSDSSLTLESPLGLRTSLRFGELPRIFRLDSAGTDALLAGSTIAVRLNEAGDTIEGVLVLSQP